MLHNPIARFAKAFMLELKTRVLLSKAVATPPLRLHAAADTVGSAHVVDAPSSSPPPPLALHRRPHR